MGLSDLAGAAIARRPDMPPMGGVPRNAAALVAAAEENSAPPLSAATALKLITTYIPTEILTLYVAVLAALHDPTLKTYPAAWIAFFFFLVVTPASVWAVYANRVKDLDKPLPLAPVTWPLWEMFAGTLAYAVWAFALPETPFGEFPWYSAALAGVAVLVLTTALGLIAPLVQHELHT